MTNAPRHVALLLAAGASRRLGRPKQLEIVDGETLIRRTARLALATHPSQLYVAIGAEIDGCTAALTGLPCISCTARIGSAAWAPRWRAEGIAPEPS